MSMRSNLPLNVYFSSSIPFAFTGPGELLHLGNSASLLLRFLPPSAGLLSIAISDPPTGFSGPLLSHTRQSDRRRNSRRRCSRSTLSRVPDLMNVLPGEMSGMGRFGVERWMARRCRVWVCEWSEVLSAEVTAGSK